MKVAAAQSLLLCAVVIATERSLRDRLPRRSLGALTQWALASVAWAFIARHAVPDSLTHSPIAWVGILWPVCIGAAESFATAVGESPREHRGSIQMDMSALLNIGFSLSAAATLAKQHGRSENARCVTLFTSSVVIMCLCFLIPNPLVFRVAVLQKAAIAIATGMLLVAAAVSMEARLCESRSAAA